MIQEIPNSHYWPDLDTFIFWLEYAKKGMVEFTPDYILTGIKNAKAHGYELVKKRKKPHGKQHRISKNNRQPKNFIL